MAIKLIATDVDGTLLNNDKALTPATVDALKAAADRGIQIVISTGRLLSEFLDLVEALPMMRYTVTCTGAQIIDLQTGRDIFRHGFNGDEIRTIYKRFEGLDALVQIFSDHDGKIHDDAVRMGYVEKYCGEALAPLLRATHVAEPDLDGFVASYEGVSNKVHVFFPGPDVKAAAMERLRDLPVLLMESAPNDLEIIPPGIDKGVGLQKLAEYLGLDASEVMALGDGGNDAAMLAYAGLGVAMQNASDEAKAAADWVLDETNDEDGVAKAVWRVLKKQ